MIDSKSLKETANAVLEVQAEQEHRNHIRNGDWGSAKARNYHVEYIMAVIPFHLLKLVDCLIIFYDGCHLTIVKFRNNRMIKLRLEVWAYSLLIN